MKARVQSVRDVRHVFDDKLPRLIFWSPGEEIADALKTVAYFIGGPAMLTVKTDKRALQMVVFLQEVRFGGDKEATFVVDVEAARKPFDLTIGEEVEIQFSEGGRQREPQASKPSSAKTRQP